MMGGGNKIDKDYNSEIHIVLCTEKSCCLKLLNFFKDVLISISKYICKCMKVGV